MRANGLKQHQGKSIDDIRPWIVGPEGSNVTLVIRRGGNQLSGASRAAAGAKPVAAADFCMFTGNRMAQFNVTLTRKAVLPTAAAAQRPLYQEQRAPA
jgi:hypothetical protein